MKYLVLALISWSMIGFACDEEGCHADHDDYKVSSVLACSDENCTHEDDDDDHDHYSANDKLV